MATLAILAETACETEATFLGLYCFFFLVSGSTFSSFERIWFSSSPRFVSSGLAYSSSLPRGARSSCATVVASSGWRTSSAGTLFSSLILRMRFLLFLRLILLFREEKRQENTKRVEGPA